MGGETDRKPLAGVLTLLGGAAIVAGSFLKWGKVALASTGDIVVQVKGGSIVLILGVGVILVGLGMLVVTARGGRVALSVVAILAGLFALLISAPGAVSKDFIRDTAADKAADAQGADQKTAEDQFRAAEESGQIEVAQEPGVFVALGGGLLVLVGGIAGLLAGPRKKSVAPADTGWGQPGVPPPGYGQQAGVPPQTGVPPPQGVPPPEQTGPPPPQGPPPPPGVPPPPPPDRGYSG